MSRMNLSDARHAPDDGVTHRCIPYCKPDEGEHTELVYGSADETEANIRDVVRKWRGGTLIRAVEEPDAPPKLDTSGKKLFDKAWLVTWRSEVSDELNKRKQAAEWLMTIP